MSLEIFKFGWFKSSVKIALHNKIFNKTWSTKNQKNYLTNHDVKFLGDKIKPWRVGALRACTGYHFF